MCIFCKIINNEIPCYKVYEDDNCLAFLDISQATIGHTLVVPKKHYENIFELNQNTTIMQVVIKVANALKDSLNVSDLNIVNNNGPLAGQTVNHFHIHLIPRYEGDRVSFIFGENKISNEEFVSLVNKISNKLKQGA